MNFYSFDFLFYLLYNIFIEKNNNDKEKGLIYYVKNC